MGTRNLTCVVLDGEYRIAQYGQWDGYPSGQGLTVLNFLSDVMDRDKFEKNLRQTRWITEEEHRKLWDEVGADGSGFVSMEISDAFKALHPQLNRDMAAEVLEFVQNADEPVTLEDSINFATDGLFCEWAYVIDLDQGLLEVYSGFNKDPLPRGSRFGTEPGDNGYTPVGLVHAYSLNDLPDEKKFLADLEENDESVTEDEVSYVLSSLRQRSDDVEIVNHICNYIEANMDDFLESVNVE